MTICFHTRVPIAKADKKRKRRRKTRTYDKLEGLSKRMANLARVDFKNGITTFKKEIPANKLRAAWSSGDFNTVMNTIPWATIDAHLDPFFGTIRDTIDKTAQMQIGTLPPNMNKELRFDTSSPSIKNYLNTRTGNMIKYIGEDARANVRDIISNSFTQARTPRDAANEIKRSIGILPQHQKALDKYRDGLIEVQTPKSLMDDLLDNQSEKYLDYRAMMIARTETRLAVNEGSNSIWREGARQGLFNAETSKRVWVVDGDPCDVCDPMDGVQTSLYEPWEVEYTNGEIRMIDNPSESHPHCYCGMEIIFNETNQEEDFGNEES